MVSVIIPLYNKVHTIQRTLDSLYQQTFSDFEVVVVDDGSTDCGWEIVKMQLDPRVKLIRRTNGGQAAARNTGLRKASGKLLAFLDADDTWNSEHLQNIVQLQKEFVSAEVFGTAYSLHYSDGNARPVATAIQKGYIDYFREFAKHGIPVLTCSSTVIKKSALYKVGFFDETIKSGVDLHYWARLALKCDVAFHPSASVNYYFQTTGNLSADRASNFDPQTRISPSVDFLQELLDKQSAPPQLIESIVLYNQSTILRGVKEALAQGNRKRAYILLLHHWSRRHFFARGIALFFLLFLPQPLLGLGLKIWKLRHHVTRRRLVKIHRRLCTKMGLGG